MERDKKHIVIQEMKLLLLYDGEEYDSMILTEKNAKFILFDIKSSYPKKTEILYYLVQQEERYDINLN
tara:strand:- start:547 stop:750 length:204 start_codon:yes stop_codon:yes gene_type:complete